MSVREISTLPGAGKPPTHKRADVRVARTLDDLMAVIALRSIVYVGEQNCPYDEEFDGNDFSGASHLLATVNGEAVGVMRIRWFADFAKAERAAVRSGFRGNDIAFALMDEALRLAANKGYAHVLGHVEPALVRYWRKRVDCSVRKARPVFGFSDREYVEVLFSTPAVRGALSLDSPPLVLNRPEGAWDVPGVLDASAERRRMAG